VAAHAAGALVFDFTLAGARMSVAFRYLARTVFYYTLLTMLAFLALFLFFDVVGELDDIGKGNYRAPQMFLYVLLQAPGHIAEFMPVAALIGTIIAFATLAAGSEVTIMRMAGLSTLRMMVWCVLLAVPIAAFTFAIDEYISPGADQRANKLRLTSMNLTLAADLSTGSWVRDVGRENGSGVRYVNAGAVNPDGTLAGVRVFEFGEDNRLLRVVTAPTGRFDQGVWTLANASETVVEHRLGITSEAVSTKLTQHPTWQWSTRLSPAVFGAIARTPDKMTLPDLRRTILYLKANGQDTEKLRLAFAKKLVAPLTLVVMLLLALPFAFLHVRAGGVSGKIFAGIMLGLVFFLITKLFSHLGALHTWPVAATALAPVLVGLTVALALLMYAQRAR
jgi:lipopolysaccharide export system permease protein